MKATYLFLFLFVGLLFTNCSNDVSDPEMGSGQEATIKFSFKLPPETKSTRAEIPGNTVENQISGIMIYVYDQAGNPPTEPTKASFGPYDLNNTAEFIKNGSVYEMVNPVKTTDGTKRIYVVANTNTASPANDLGTFGTESQLLSRIYDVHKAGTQGALINYNATPVVTHIVFAGSTQQQLLPFTSGQTNQVQVDIERTVSRVITTCDDGSFTGEWTSGNNYTLTISKFLVKQDAYKGVVGQNYFDAPNATRKKTLISETPQPNWYNVVNQYLPFYYLPSGLGNNIDIDYVDILPTPNSETELTDLKGFYIGENVTNTTDKDAQHGNTTYAWIQTRLALEKTAELNGAETEVVYTGGSLSGTETFHLVRVRGVQDYICRPENSVAVATFLHSIYPNDVSTYEFPFGFIYYRIFLNRVGPDGKPLGEEDKYNVYRNQFIHLDITGVVMSGEAGDPNDPTVPGGPGGFGPGYPGNPPADTTNPDDPGPKVPVDPFNPPVIDPNDPTKPGGGPGDNPNPHEPEEPIDETEADLKVNITIKPWEYMYNDLVLE